MNTANRRPNYAVILQLTLLIVAFFQNSQLQSADYDPMAILQTAPVESLDFSVLDQPRARKIPIRIYLPAEFGQSTPVILFSHGLGGSKEGNRFMGEHWARRGYLVVFLQHAGSDETVWKGVELRERLTAMRNAASPQSLFLRCGDVRTVLDQIDKWNQDTKHPLYGKMDLLRVGMSGHSFGAHTTQATSGQSFPVVGQKFVDDRIDAAIAFSPSSPARGNSNSSFSSVKIPWMLMTGTKDASPIGDQTIESRLEVYPNLPKTLDKFELVLDNAEHSAFTDRALPGDKQKRNAKHHKAILALSTAFWDSYLMEDANAKIWLAEKAKSVLEEKDRWQSQIANSR